MKEKIGQLNSSVLVHKSNISWPLRISPYEILVARRSFILGVASQHTLNAHADALNILDGAPALGAEEVKANDAVGIDVWVDGDGTFGDMVYECYFGRFYNEKRAVSIFGYAMPLTIRWGRGWESGLYQ